jgi:hypothetical protein
MSEVRRQTRPAGAGAHLSDLCSLFSVLWSEAPSTRSVLGAERRERVRAIRTARLHALPRLHLRPIDVVVDHGSRRDLVLRRVSRLDAFSGYPCRT